MVVSEEHGTASFGLLWRRNEATCDGLKTSGRRTAVSPSLSALYYGQYNFQLFMSMWPRCIVTNFFIIKPTRCTKFTNLFCHENLHVSDSLPVHHQEFIHCTLSKGICQTAFEQEHMLLLESCLQTCMTYTIAECTVNQLLMMDRRTLRNM
jgi:hypothetical protein